MSTIYVGPDEGTRYRMIDGDHVAKAAVHGPDGAFEVFEVVAPALPAAPAHVSPWSGVLYVLEGTVLVTADGATDRVEAGGLVVVPAGTPVTFEVREGTARFLAITSGDGAGRFFADAATAVAPDRPLEETMATMLAVTARHGVRLAPA